MNEEQQRQYEMTVLEAYFKDCRSTHAPGYICERKNSEEIAFDLAEIMPMPNERILEYLMENDYTIGCDASGRMSWAIWRRLTSDEEDDGLESYDYE